MVNSSDLIVIAEKAKISINDEEASKMLAYMYEILEMNKHINLTGLKNEDEFLIKQVIDSIMLLNQKELASANKVVDVGTGAGFPGVPLAICLPDVEFVLIDSLKKRLLVVNEICNKLKINNVKTIHTRAESVGRDKNHREKYDICVSKAVAPLNILLEYCLPLVREGGSFYAYKGEAAEEELKISKRAVKELSGGNPELVKSNYKEIEGLENHIFVKINKINKTKNTYPRNEGIPNKKPL